MLQRTLRQTTKQMGWNTLAILMAAPLQYSLITVNVVALKKNSLLVIHKILRLFLNTLIVDQKYYLLTIDNLTQTIRIKLSQKQNTFCGFFVAFLKSIFNFKHFPKKEDHHSWCISGNTGSKKYAEINV